MTSSFTVEDGSTLSRTGYIAHKDSTVHLEKLGMSDLRIRMHDHAAVVTGKYYEKGASKGKPCEYHDRFTIVAVCSTNHIPGLLSILRYQGVISCGQSKCDRHVAAAARLEGQSGPGRVVGRESVKW